MANPRVLMDGIVFERQSHGGVSRMYREILPRLCEVDPCVQVSVFTNKRVAQAVPIGTCIDHFTVFSPERFLRPVRLLAWSHTPLRSAFVQPRVWGQQRWIWHSTYYTKPRFWKGPVVLTVFDLIHERFPHMFSHDPQARTFMSHKAKCISESDVIVAISDSTKADLVMHYDIDPQKIAVMHLAAGSSFCLPSPTEHRVHARPYILYVGRRDQYKNVGFLLDGYSRWGWNVEVDLLLVGPPPAPEDLPSSRASRARPRVHFLVDVPDSQLAAVYSQALGFVYPSLYEGFGMPLLEAMASGCPVVASEIPSSREVAGDAASYFDPHDEGSLLQALDKLLDPFERESLVEKGKHRVKAFTWTKAAAELARVYGSLS